VDRSGQERRRHTIIVRGLCSLRGHLTDCSINLFAGTASTGAVAPVEAFPADDFDPTSAFDPAEPEPRPRARPRSVLRV
jgi:hypothetical protein